MALVNTGIDSWMLEYEACEKLSREIMEQLHVRDKELPGSMPYDSLSGRVRLRLRQYSNEVTQLRTKLKTPDSAMYPYLNVLWMLEYEACEKLSREIMEQLHVRDKELPGSMPYDSLSGRVRLRLRQYSNEVTQLRTKLKTPDSAITDGEKERRVRQVDELQSRLVQLEKQFNGSNDSSRRGPVVRAATSGWADDDDDDDEDKFSIKREIRNNAPISDLRAEQAQLLRDQEAGLEQLSTVIARQKRIATVIHEEVDDQNALLDEIATNVDQIDTRVRGETGQISTIIRKDTTCWYWMVILLLMIAIVGVMLAPGR